MTSVRKSHPPFRMLSTVALVPAFLASSALAANHEHREHDAHAHGHGTLDIVVEGEIAMLELRMPGVNVVGFEHAPKDDAEHEAVRRALEPLQDGASVFVLTPKADCVIEQSAAEISAVAHEDHHDEGHHDEGHHDDEHHAADEHAEHEHEAEVGEEEHSELHATYLFRCGAPDRLDWIETHVLEHLHDVEEIDVRAVTPSAQLATELHEGSTVVDLTP